MLEWDEPAGASSPRGWLYSNGTAVGWYLDYGADHNRPHHETEIRPGKVVSFCQPDRLCQDCRPGSILVSRYPDGPHTETMRRYVETIAEARAFVESGVTAAVA